MAKKTKAAVIEAPPTLAVTDLVENPLNPRQAWKPEQIEPFRESLRRFGDLGGIVMNLTTGQLVGGHKRVEVFKAHADAEIVKTEQPEDAQGTVAHGYVLVDGGRFAYREVRWPPATEVAANLAANRWGADWDWQIVSDALQALSSTDLLPFTGFPAHELDNLLAADWAPTTKEDLPEAAADHPHTVHLSAEQYAVLQQAKQKIAESDATESTDTTPLSDGRAIELVCADFLSGI